MDHLQKCALVFEHLLDINYHVITGRKGKSVKLNILFDPIKLHHLIGFHKPRDLRVARANREKVFQNCLSGTLSIQDLMKSRHFFEIEKRIQPFDKIETFLDSNQLVLRRNKELQTFSLIETEYLLSTHFENTDVYTLLDQLSEENQFLYRSFFPKEKKDHTIGQSQFTLLFEEKITVSTREKIIQYDRLTPKNRPVSIPSQGTPEKGQVEQSYWLFCLSLFTTTAAYSTPSSFNSSTQSFAPCT